MGAQKMPEKIGDEGTTHLSELTMFSVASNQSQFIQPKHDLHKSLCRFENTMKTKEGSCQMKQPQMLPMDARCVSVDLPLLTFLSQECNEPEEYTGNNLDMMASLPKIDTTCVSPNSLFQNMHESTAPLPIHGSESDMNLGLWNENDLVDIWTDTGQQQQKTSVEGVVSIMKSDHQ